MIVKDVGFSTKAAMRGFGIPNYMGRGRAGITSSKLTISDAGDAERRCWRSRGWNY